MNRKKKEKDEVLQPIMERKRDGRGYEVVEEPDGTFVYWLMLLLRSKLRMVGYICSPDISGFHMIGLVLRKITMRTHAYAIITQPKPNGINHQSGEVCQ